MEKYDSEMEEFSSDHQLVTRWEEEDTVDVESVLATQEESKAWKVGDDAEPLEPPKVALRDSSSLAHQIAHRRKNLAELFLVLFPIQILESIAHESDRYANKDWVKKKKVHGKDQLVPCSSNDPQRRHRSRVTSHKIGEITPGYVLAFLGILTHFGSLESTRSPTLYWKRENGLPFAFIQNTMTKEAFVFMRRHIQFADNRKQPKRSDSPKYDPLHKVKTALFVIARALASTTKPEWRKYSHKEHGFYDFQVDLAHAIIEKGIRIDWNDPEFKESTRPKWTRQYEGVDGDYFPCSCRKCFFCKVGKTNNVANKPTTGLGIPSAPPEHARMPTVVSKRSQRCALCLTKRNDQCRSQTEASEEGESLRARKIRTGCPACDKVICNDCWPDFHHDLS